MIDITLVSECQINPMVSGWFKATFCILYCTKQFNPKTEDSSSNKKLERCLDANLIKKNSLDLTLKKSFLICETELCSKEITFLRSLTENNQNIFDTCYFGYRGNDFHKIKARYVFIYTAHFILYFCDTKGNGGTLRIWWTDK